MTPAVLGIIDLKWKEKYFIVINHDGFLENITKQLNAIKEPHTASDATNRLIRLEDSQLGLDCESYQWSVSKCIEPGFLLIREEIYSDHERSEYKWSLIEWDGETPLEKWREDSLSEFEETFSKNLKGKWFDVLSITQIPRLQELFKTGKQGEKKMTIEAPKVISFEILDIEAICRHEFHGHEWKKCAQDDKDREDQGPPVEEEIWISKDGRLKIRIGLYHENYVDCITIDTLEKDNAGFYEDMGQLGINADDLSSYGFLKKENEEKVKKREEAQRELKETKKREEEKKRKPIIWDRTILNEAEKRLVEKLERILQGKLDSRFCHDYYKEVEIATLVTALASIQSLRKG